MTRLAAILALALAAGPVAAKAPEQSLRPVARAVVAPAVSPDAAESDVIEDAGSEGAAAAVATITVLELTARGRALSDVAAVESLAGTGAETAPDPEPVPGAEPDPAPEPAVVVTEGAPPLRPGARPAVLAGAGQSGAESGRADAVPESDAGVREQAGLDRSLRPVSRPRDLDVTAAPAPAPAPEPAPAAEPRAAEPARPQTARAITPETLGVKPEAEPKPRGLLALLRPKQRSPAVDDKARRQGAARRQGSVCGDPEIQGVAVGKVAGTLKGCGVVDAVRIQSVAGIGLSTHAVMDCKTAQTLRAWVDSGLRPSVGRHGGGVAQLRVAAHYACRGRNNQKGARISEHGKGRAIDISAFRLRDGTEISVLKDWGNGTKGQILRNLHRTACGPFGTVLGPNSDRFHKDHFHLDTARYRSGSYCR